MKTSNLLETWFKNNKTVLNLIFNTVFVLFRFNKKSLKLQTSFIPPVTSKSHLPSQ